MRGDLLELLEQGFAGLAQEDSVGAFVRLATHSHRQRAAFQFIEQRHHLRRLDGQGPGQVGLHQPRILVDDRQGRELRGAQVMG
ncbi:hypothetical protein D3C79_842480 [compost metagenome]